MIIYNKKLAVIHPYYKTWSGGPDLTGLPESLRLRRNCVVCDAEPPAVLESLRTQEGHYLWGGPLKVHFGHLMVDTLPRLWPYSAKSYDGIIFSLLIGDKLLGKWAYSLLKSIGIDRENLILVSDPAKFESVDFALPGSALGEGPSGWYLSRLSKSKFCSSLPKSNPLSPKLHLSRCHIRNKGGVMGESWFESRFL